MILLETAAYLMIFIVGWALLVQGWERARRICFPKVDPLRLFLGIIFGVWVVLVGGHLILQGDPVLAGVGVLAIVAGGFAFPFITWRW